MENHSIFSISPIDGRYHIYTQSLKNYFSEFALFKYRLMIEVEYLIYLKKIGLPELQNFPSDTFFLKIFIILFHFLIVFKSKILNLLLITMLKNVEYFFSQQLQKNNLSNYKSFIHFGLTSQDINNNSITLSIKNCIEDVIIPLLENILSDLLEKSSTLDTLQNA